MAKGELVEFPPLACGQAEGQKLGLGRKTAKSKLEYGQRLASTKVKRELVEVSPFDMMAKWRVEYGWWCMTTWLLGLVPLARVDERVGYGWLRIGWCITELKGLVPLAGQRPRVSSTVKCRRVVHDSETHKGRHPKVDSRYDLSYGERPLVRCELKGSSRSSSR